MTRVTDEHVETVKFKKKLYQEVQDDLMGKIEDALDKIAELDPLYYYIKREAAEAAAELIMMRIAL